MKYLFVDLDESLLKCDLLFESVFNAIKLRPWLMIYFFLFFLNKKKLKRFFYINSKIDFDNIPINQDVVKYIKDWKNLNQGKVIIATASYYKYAKIISEKFDFIDAYYGTDKTTNLKGIKKLNLIKKISKSDTFDYIGDSFNDLAIFHKAKVKIIVNPSTIMTILLQKFKKVVVINSQKPNFLLVFIKQIRLYQYTKNLIIFAPLLVNGDFSSFDFLDSLIAFLCFCLLASSIYIFNDIFDLKNDRLHEFKKNRPLASGQISIKSSIFIALIFLNVSLITIYFKLNSLLNIYLFYFSLNILYTFILKKILILDILVLSVFYNLRIYIGQIVNEISISLWFFSFTTFLFLFLAILKRYIDLQCVTSKSATMYHEQDKNILINISIASYFAAIIVFFLYINSYTAYETFQNRASLWLIGIILFYWFSRLLITVTRNKINDLILFVIRDVSSYVCFLLTVIIYIYAK